MRTHPITGMSLEDGFGALPDDQQAILLHLPYIEKTRGKEVADAMRIELEPPPVHVDTASDKLSEAIHDVMVEATHEAGHGQ